MFSNTGGERKTGTLFGNTTGPPGGLFANSQQQQQPPQQSGGGLFSNTGGGLLGGQQQQQQQQQNLGGSLFNQSQQPQPQQQQQQQQQGMSNTIFGGNLQPAPTLNASQRQSMQQSQGGLPQLRQTANSAYPSSSMNGQREKSVKDQIQVIHDKWDSQHPNCAFEHYFYNSVEPDQVPFYGPQPYEDERKWEEALSNKPSPGSIPILARGFDDIVKRIHYQNLAVSALQTRLHEINASLGLMKQSHELSRTTRINEAKRKHIIFTQRTLALATKVQILRNRGYDMDQAEEGLKKKLMELEKKTFDPVLGGRQEEIWARMSGVRERARILQQETERLGKTVDAQQNSGEFLSSDDQKALEKLLKDYDKQLEHLKKWIDDTKEEYEAWDAKKKPTKAAGGR
ncbi:hypothetical protein K504DRAFT_429276 [Pleomassaria siparia CBS 279.74]|uniref:Nucleoporin Nup54 alpha-helical domain-containing protein n=1 Tax=Pleomassaria siparia CBS 279.74 TaxID=1314801 RepID=A0A6G1KEW5_9PLEO|nr:hypothetical protein K504DRAFT_429276 [Pleomassaria siparia CBS 279.74]